MLYPPASRVVCDGLWCNPDHGEASIRAVLYVDPTLARPAVEQLIVAHYHWVVRGRRYFCSEACAASRSPLIYGP